MVIETERLLLREMTEEDFSALYKMLADSDIMQHYPYVFDEKKDKELDFAKYRKISGVWFWLVGCMLENNW